ncbi:molybdopterin-synthase adenylyltransferase MoeB [Psychromonas sp. psych-6C06]|uniref:HesA/MoeB/ThiF family protein n=1 Tax=Psychromonas sp. psych-6C06 TaxID=2058089 RepID=UPI000C339FCD|nr:HesA/MoeB/ThiF family protein [Psychromonas sp. psych-6C06]PKF61709.1 molybdopterin-synthase adenylyltransferase MoeB [Psychromonas sp. psych-6C06]
MLTDAEMLRYSRHLLLEEVGELGQKDLKKGKVLIIGMGGLGSPASLYLAAAGVGSIVIADFDCLEVSNLQRQIAYKTADIGTDKVALMKQRLEQLNPEVRVRSITREMDKEQLMMELMMVNLVLDCTDNMASRQMINAACVEAQVPLIVGAAIRMEGQLMFFDHGEPEAACYHCLFPTDEEQTLNCSNSGVLGPVVGTIGTLQALEAIKHITGLPSGIKNKLKLFDGKTLDWQTFAINKDPQCNVCGNR